MAKRFSGNQLTKNDSNDEDETDDSQIGHWKSANDETIAQRRSKEVYFIIL